MSQTMLVQDVMTSQPHSIGVSLTLADAKKLMREKRIRHLPVLDGGTLVGVLSDRDVQLIASLVKDSSDDEILVEEAMSQVPYTVSPTTPLSLVARQMERRRLGSAVVMAAGKVTGIFTATDALRALAQLLDEGPAPRGLVMERPKAKRATRTSPRRSAAQP
jgi:acetoin utilization protein AcuB